MGILPGSAGDVDTSAHFLNSANGTGSQSLAKLPDLDQDTVNTTYQGDLGGGGSVFSNPAGPLGQVFGDVAGLPDAFGQLVSKLFGTAGPFASIGGAINQIEQNVIGGIQQTIVLINAAVAAVQAFVNAIINAIIVGLRSIPLGIGVGPADALAALTGAAQDSQNKAQNATITAISRAARNPLWECRYAIGDVSFAESQMLQAFVNGTTGPASAGTGHTHGLFDGVANKAGPGQSFAAPAAATGAFIGTSISTTYDTVAAWMCTFTATPAINNVFIEVFREAQDTSLTLVSSNNISSLLTGTAFVYVEVPLATPIVALAGERYLVRFRNSSTTSNAAGIAALNRPVVGPEISFVTKTAADTNRTSYTAAQAASFTGVDPATPWFALGSVNQPTADQSYSDPFDRVTLGPKWALKSNTGANQFGITSKQAAFIGTTNGDQLGFYTDSVNGDQMLVEANLYGKVAVPMLGVMSCCNRDLSQTVQLAGNLSAMHIYHGPWNALVDTGVSVADPGDDSKWGLYNDPSTDIFTILKNGTDVGAWPAAGAVQHGFDYRFGGVRISRVAGVNAGTQDNWTFRDYAA